MNTTTVLVTGNTYPVKDAIKALGGRWDADAKGWRVPAAKASEAQALVTSAPASKPRSSSFRAGNVCVSCGHREQRNARGYVVGDRVYKGECQSCRDERQTGY